ncbi:MAG: LptF/LptG family permease [Pirellulaceae bacterium]|nr:LptF/LptG family permease [Pirellulaceae bacterium]
MTRIDRYILFMFVRVLLICFGSMVGLLIVVHAFTNLDELIAYGKVRGSVAKGLFEYYGPYSLALLDRFCGLLALLAIMFVVSWLRRTNEMTVIMAAGVGPRRILVYPIVASLVLFVGMAVMRETVIPLHEEMLGKNPQDLSATHLRPVVPVYDAKYGILVGGRNLSLSTKEIRQPIFRLDGPTASIGSQLQAATGRYLAADQEHPAGYLLEGVSSPDAIDSIASILHESHPLLMTARDYPWVKSQQCFVATNVEFAELIGGNAWKQYASTFAIISRLRSASSHVSNDLRLTVHKRFVQPMLDFTMLLLGIPILLMQKDRNIFWVMGATFFTVGVFMISTMLLHNLASSSTELPPFLGAWLPVLIFGPIAFARARVAMLT